MVNFDANFLSNIPKIYLPIVLLEKFQISSIINPTLSCSPVTKAKLQKSSGRKTDTIKMEDQNDNQDQLDEYNLVEQDIISTCYNLETELQEHDTQVLSTHDRDLIIKYDSCQKNDSCENLSWTDIVNKNCSSAKTTQVEVKVYSLEFCPKEQKLFPDEQILEKVPRINSLSNVENDELQADELEIDVEGLSESDEESRNIRLEDFHKNLSSNELKVVNSIGDSSNDESSRKYQPSQTAKTIKEPTDRGYRSKFHINSNQVTNQASIKDNTNKQLKKCPDCDFVTKWNLARHMIRHIPDRPYKCSDCNYSSKTKHLLIHHIRIHTGEKSYKCSVCSYLSTSSTNLQRHIRTHTGFRPYKCSQCLYASAYLVNLKRHSLTHTDIRPFTCAVCAFSTKTYQTLQIHSRIHSGIKPFKCTQCLYASTTATSLKRHSLTHLIEKTYKCSHCLFATQTLKTFKKHLRTHEEKDSTDTNTNKSEIQLKSLINTKKQPQEQLYSCYDCKRSFKRKKSLEKHWKCNHYSQFQKVKNYHCLKCRQVSTCYDSFIRHLQVTQE